MLWAIFSTFLSSIGSVFYKKTTEYNIRAELNDLFWHIWAILWIVIILFIWKLNLSLTSYLDYILIFSTFVLFFINMKVNQYVVRQETISALIPFENLWRVLTVLFWVFILNDEISNIALSMFIWVVVLILFFSIDIKKLKFSKNIILYCFAELLNAIASLIIGYILLSNSSLDYYSVYTIISLSFMLILCWILKIYWTIKTLDTWYYINRWISSLNWISWLISILLIKELWLSITTLLSFLWIWITLIVSYLVFKDIPTKKSLLLTLAILTLIWIWYSFK